MKKAGAKKKATKKKAAVEQPPTFEELRFAAARADYTRLQEIVLSEIQAGKPSKIKCARCKKKIERKDLTSYFCPNCPGTVYKDAATGLEIRMDAGVLASLDQINRLAAARARVAEAKSKLPVMPSEEAPSNT